MLDMQKRRPYDAPKGKIKYEDNSGIFGSHQFLALLF
jgi:hypothetical protein